MSAQNQGLGSLVIESGGGVIDQNRFDRPYALIRVDRQENKGSQRDDPESHQEFLVQIEAWHGGSIAGKRTRLNEKQTAPKTGERQDISYLCETVAEYRGR